jgi:hypothetical protein
MKSDPIKNFKRFTLEEIRKMRGQTNWARLYSEEQAEKKLAQATKKSQVTY